MKNLVEIKNLHKSYLKVGEGFGGGRVKVLDGVSFTIEEGLCVGLIGESGSGKSTLSRLVLGLEKPDKSGGGVTIEGLAVRDWLKANRGQMSVVFQDYTTSVNPRFTVAEAIAEPLVALGQKRVSSARLDGLLERVGLSGDFKGRFAHTLSGGQLQRVCIARAIATEPRFIVLDEAISALDVSIQAQIMALLHRLQVEMGMTYLFVAHDLQAVAHLCNKIVFLNKGRIVETCMSGELGAVKDPYAKALLQSVIGFDVGSI